MTPNQAVATFPDFFAGTLAKKTSAMTRASNDGEAVNLWLSEYSNPHTHAALRKEAERFLLWAASRQQVLAAITREDVIEFEGFLLDPQPAALWCGKRVARTGIDGAINPQWRPFLGPLSPQSQQLARSRIGNLFDYLLSVGYLKRNPFAISRGRRTTAPRTERSAERIIDNAMWLAIQRAIRNMPRQSEQERTNQIRADWIVNLLYLTGARRSEAATAKMGDIFQKKANWWWRINGKGGVQADIPLPPALITKLIHYRESMGLTAQPTANDDTPLICSVHVGRSSTPMTPRHLHAIVKEVMARAVITLEGDSNPEQQTISALKRASAHWFRHSYATRILESGARLDEARRLLRHASIQTTQIYLHQEDQSLVDAVSRLAAAA